MSVSQSPESESQSPNPAGDESGQINRPTKAETLRRRAAYAFGNLGQSAFYNALSTYFVVYVTSVLFVNVEKSLGHQTHRTDHKPYRDNPYRRDLP